MRIIVRSLGVCRGKGKVLDMHNNRHAEADTDDDVCYAPQTPEDARACVGSVSMVVFEVRRRRLMRKFVHQ